MTMSALSDLQTPALLLDRRKMRTNIARMRGRLEALGVGFRPHIKTAKSVEVIREMLGPQLGPVTVSTLLEAEQLAARGFTDILYAVGLTPNKLNRVRALRDRGVDVKVIIDSVDAARVLRRSGHDDPIPVLIEIDTDGHRAGVKPDNGDHLLAIAEALNGNLRLAGVLTHAGGSYNARSDDELRHHAALERDGIVLAAETIRAAGYPVDVVSVGSTPTMMFATNLSGVTEARAGVFVFFDMVMAGIGVCTIDDIALSVQASISGVQRDRGHYLIDAGWMAMSRDRGTAAQTVDQGYGLVCDMRGNPYADLIVSETSQEHGVLALRSGSTHALPDLGIGDLVRILPNHACATGAQHSGYWVLDEDDHVIDYWQRFGGW